MQQLQRKDCLVGIFVIVCLGLLTSVGCYAPMRSPGIPASTLPDSYRMYTRSAGQPLNFANLTLPAPDEYILGPGDILEVTIHDLYPSEAVRPLRCPVMGSGDIQLPLVGAVHVGGMNQLQAHKVITAAYTDEYIKDPRTNVYLVEASTTNVLVIGEVNRPGAYKLPKYENDVAHALAMAGGIGDEAGRKIEVHRRISPEQAENEAFRAHLSRLEPGGVIVTPAPTEGAAEELATPLGEPEVVFDSDDPKVVLQIPLRGLIPGSISQNDVRLQPGDVVVVPSREHEVFYVVGKLNQTNQVRFSSGREVRDLGVGFLLPRDRDIDVVTAVVMAGYIDPIDSPTTVTLQRTRPGCRPMLIHVDLIKARTCRLENIMVQAGDIIYLNPDGPWWFRRTFDRIIPELILYPYQRSVLKWFGQERN